MKYIFKNRLVAFMISLILLIVILHSITYAFDKKLIEKDNEPKFCINTGGLKDGGTKFYYGLGYQIIKWNYMSKENVDGKYVSGIKHGFEIHRFPFFVDWGKGPTIKLEFRQFKKQ